jgi:hypothetical protein
MSSVGIIIFLASIPVASSLEFGLIAKYIETETPLETKRRFTDLNEYDFGFRGFKQG